MRKIKFRGKRLDNGEWVFGCLIDYSVIKQISHGKLCILHESGSCEVDPDTVGQFTGFGDSEGIEVYESDRLEGHDDGEVSIEWSEDCWICRFDKQNVIPLCELLDWYNPKVIGSIHDKETD